MVASQQKQIPPWVVAERTASRRALVEVVDRLRISQRPPPEPGWMHEAAKIMVLRDPHPWRHPEQFGITSKQAAGITDTVRQAVRRLRSSDVPGAAPWTGGFWLGLQMSGAVTEWKGRLVAWGGRPWLWADLQEAKIPCRLGTGRYRRWLWCPAAWVPAESRIEIDVLAGLLAGARREKDEEGGEWLAVPRTPETLGLLQYWGVSMMPGKNGCVLVSPFWGMLLTGHMPPASGGSMVVKQAGGCPLLPLVIWQVLWGADSATQLLPPRAGLLPYLVGDATRRRRGWGVRVLKDAAVALGVAQVSLGMRELLVRWRALHERTREQTDTPQTGPSGIRKSNL